MSTELTFSTIDKIPNTKLTFVQLIKSSKENGNYAIFYCECGSSITSKIERVLNLKVTSCGCYQRNKLKEMVKSNIPFKNGSISQLPEYSVWLSIRDRTTNKENDSYLNYGGRGITVCDDWFYSFENFYRDMGSKPGPEYSIDRIDNDEGYEPGNCRWATSKEQARNKRSTIIVTYKGITKPLIDWSEDLKLDYKVLYNRLRSNWVIEDIFEKPIENSNLYTLNIDNYKNESKTVKEWSRILGISFYTVQARLDRGWSIDDALLTPVQKSLLKPTSNKPPWVKVWGIK